MLVFFLFNHFFLMFTNLLFLTLLLRSFCTTSASSTLCYTSTSTSTSLAVRQHQTVVQVLQQNLHASKNPALQSPSSPLELESENARVHTVERQQRFEYYSYPKHERLDLLTQLLRTQL
ncbi:MAG: hypothetical protein J3R72DRAFT_162147 [Linnemannia gamsii]|nr:MAG: hypothetical protein J3R72DRAFT_162147 [Linnemannia gamsii]